MEAVLLGRVGGVFCAADQIQWLKPVIGVFVAAKVFSLAQSMDDVIEDEEKTAENANGGGGDG